MDQDREGFVGREQGIKRTLIQNMFIDVVKSIQLPPLALLLASARTWQAEAEF